MSFNKRLSFESLEARLPLATDFAILSVTLTNAMGEVTGQTPVIGEKVYAVVHYQVTDPNPADAYNISWTMDGVTTEQLGFANLAGSDGDRFWYHGGWIAQPGSHSVTVTIDSDNSVAETNESNNTATSTAFTSLSPTGSLPNKFVTPIAGTQNVDWVVDAYVDVDPRNFLEGEDVYRDYQGNTTVTRDFHNGIDIRIPHFADQDAGVPVLAAEAGTVVEIRDGQFDRELFGSFDPGNYVFIDHGNGWVTQYYHVRRESISVNVGDAVTSGQQIALVGSSGNSGGPHLHFEVQHNGSPVEPFAAPSDYFVSPLPYTYDVGPTVLDMGITNVFPFYEDVVEHVSDNQSFPQQDLFLFPWVIFASIEPGDIWELKLYQPNGTEYVQTVDPIEFPTDIAGSWQWNRWWSLFIDDPAAGNWRMDIYVNNDKVDEKSFQVGTSAPEIRVAEDVNDNDVINFGDTVIIDGRATPLDFGTVDFGDTGPTKTFVVENHGYANLTTTAVLPVGYVFVEPLSSTIAAGASDTFTVRLLTNSVGTKAGEITIFTNDASEATFNFKVEGLVDGSDADFDNDGDVDGRDFLAWQRGFGTTPDAVKADGDATGEGTVDGADLAIWQTQYGTPPSLVAAATADDELPGNLLLALDMFATEEDDEKEWIEELAVAPVLSVDAVFAELPVQRLSFATGAWEHEEDFENEGESVEEFADLIQPTL
jgi:murein DD-endopeptidase MepM/ murein hydrolase activator NlpD